MPDILPAPIWIAGFMLLAITGVVVLAMRSGGRSKAGRNGGDGAYPYPAGAGSDGGCSDGGGGGD